MCGRVSVCVCVVAEIQSVSCPQWIAECNRVRIDLWKTYGQTCAHVIHEWVIRLRALIVIRSRCVRVCACVCVCGSVHSILARLLVLIRECCRFVAIVPATNNQNRLRFTFYLLATATPATVIKFARSIFFFYFFFRYFSLVHSLTL